MRFFQWSSKYVEGTESSTRRIRRKAPATTQQSGDGHRIVTANHLVGQNGYAVHASAKNQAFQSDGQQALSRIAMIQEGNRKQNVVVSSTERHSENHDTVPNSIPSPIRPYNVQVNQNSKGLYSWIPYVEQSADDGTVKDRVRDVFSFTEQFVYNFYTDRSYDGEVSDEVLDMINCSPVFTTSEIQELLTEADRHTTLIKHTLISLLLELISFSSFSDRVSLLPREFENYSSLAVARSTSTTAEGEIINLQPALSTYRVLSAYLRPNIQQDEHYLQERKLTASSVVQNFEDAFGHWINMERDPGERQEAFHELLSRTANLGIFLFSQPSVFDFIWKETRAECVDGSIPIFPRLLRVYDHEAQLQDWADHLIPMKQGALFWQRDPSDRGLLIQTKKPSHKNQRTIPDKLAQSKSEYLGVRSLETAQAKQLPHRLDHGTRLRTSPPNNAPEQPYEGELDNDRLQRSFALRRLPGNYVQAKGHVPFAPQHPEDRISNHDQREQVISTVKRQLEPRSNALQQKLYHSEVTNKPEYTGVSKALPPPPPYVPEIEAQEVAVLTSPPERGCLISQGEGPSQYHPDEENSIDSHSGGRRYITHQPLQNQLSFRPHEHEYSLPRRNTDQQLPSSPTLTSNQPTRLGRHERSTSSSPPKRYQTRHREKDQDREYSNRSDLPLPPPTSYPTNMNNAGVKAGSNLYEMIFPEISTVAPTSTRQGRSSRRRSYSESSVGMVEQSRSSSMTSFRRKMKHTKRDFDGDGRAV